MGLFETSTRPRLRAGRVFTIRVSIRRTVDLAEACENQPQGGVGYMSEEHPGPDLNPPTEELKIIGKPRIEETNSASYSVQLDLSRKLTAGEYDAVAAWATPAGSPAGLVSVDQDLKHLTVGQTTIEKVAEHRDSLREIVSRIAAQGEEYRKRAIDARREADEVANANEAERARRKKLAQEINFDD